MKRIIVKLVATLTIMSMSVFCSKENSAGYIWLLSESGTVDYSAQDVQLGYKVILDNGSSVSVTADADWIKIGTLGESYVTLSFPGMIPEKNPARQRLPSAMEIWHH